MTVTYSKLQYIPRTNELVEDPREVVYAICPACEYVSYNIPRREDDAHDELCCGTAAACSALPGDLCVTHEGYPSVAEMMTLAERAQEADDTLLSYI